MNRPPTQPGADRKALFAALNDCMLEDRFRLRRRLQDAIRKEKSVEAIEKRIKGSVQRVRQRIRDRPTITSPEELPISSHRNKLVELLESNQVVVVCGETGSGKSTQIPKICIDAGYGVRGLICQTQPRRIAARSVAQRISDELGNALGQVVGYRVRFSEEISDHNMIRVLTDGMLLAEFERDRYLNRYEVLIVDEAHERSLNIDFLLGLARRIAARRPEFRLIITSATLDSDKFGKHFGNAPVLSVSGRTYPVEQRYRPLESNDGGMDTMPLAIQQGIVELQSEKPGDVLVFLPGEREIRESAAFLRKGLKPGFEILPLYARLTPGEQQRIFKPSGSRRIILSTNVAETSLTVPGIRYVIDTGLARVSRYSPTRKLQRLPLEKVSKAAASQRAGRCGRVADGICIRLYDEDDFDGRPDYTDPEILRTSLADVILRMKSLGLGDIDRFPFVDPPSRRQINDGMQHLIELGALSNTGRITDVGRQIARIPVDPRIARMLLAARQLNCLDDVIVIAAALSVPDPRQNPADKLEHSRQKQRELSASESDFLVLLDIWRQFRHIQKSQSKRQSYKWCEEHFLSIFRMREWGALQASIKSIMKQLQLGAGGAGAEPDIIHRALLPGLLSNVAQLSLSVGDRKKGGRPKGAQYDGTFGKTLQLFPGSALRGKSPRWIMSAELMETARVYARTAATIQPQWLESAAEHLLSLHYSDPVWDRRQERVVAKRRATLYGLTVYSGRRCDYSRINPEDCRMIFIRSALVDGYLDSKLPFYDHNRALVAEIIALEHKTRRRDILVDDDEIFNFYDALIPDHVNSASLLRKWYRSLDDEDRASLQIPRQQLLLSDPEEARNDYPDRLDHNGIGLPLDYLFDPASPKDGVTARIKLPLLNQMSAAVFDRLVPGLLEPKLVALVRSLPKSVRRKFVPIPDTVAQIRDQVAKDSRPLLASLAEALNEIRACGVGMADFDVDALPDFLQIGLELVDDDHRTLGFSKNLESLQNEFGLRAHASFVDAGDADIERQNIRHWDFDVLPASVTVRVGEYLTRAYPALVDCEDSAAIEVFDDGDVADLAHRDGVRRLLWLALPGHRKLLKKPLPDWQRISLMYAAVGDLSTLQLSMFYKAQDQVFFHDRELPRTRQAFDVLRTVQAPGLPAVLVDIASSVRDALSRYRQAKQALGAHAATLPEAAVTDIEQQLEWLVYDGFVDDTPVQWLPQLARFLEAITVRIEQARLDPGTDQLRQQKVASFWERFLTSDSDYSQSLEHFRFMVEEYRVSVFAQGLKTSIRVSRRRLDQAWKDVIAEQKSL